MKLSSKTLPKLPFVMAVAAANAVDLSSLSSHLEDRLEVTKKLLTLTSGGDPEATTATLNSARMEMVDIKANIAQAKEEIRQWREQLRKVRNLQFWCNT